MIKKTIQCFENIKKKRKSVDLIKKILKKPLLQSVMLNKTIICEFMDSIVTFIVNEKPKIPYRKHSKSFRV